MSCLYQMVDYDVSIGIEPQPIVPRNLKEMHNKLPMHSIVRQIASNLVQAINGPVSTAAQEEELQVHIDYYGESILDLFLDYNLDSKIITPLSEDGMPVVNTFIMQAVSKQMLPVKIWRTRPKMRS